MGRNGRESGETGCEGVEDSLGSIGVVERSRAGGGTGNENIERVEFE